MKNFSAANNALSNAVDATSDSDEDDEDDDDEDDEDDMASSSTGSGSSSTAQLSVTKKYSRRESAPLPLRRRDTSVNFVLTDVMF